MTDRMNVESFNLDHTKVDAPFIRLADRKELPQGDTLVKWDIRFKQPNVEHLEMPAVHSLEHMFAEHARNHADNVIDFGPMGCQTGFYLMLSGDVAEAEVADLVEKTLTDITNATEVPAANEKQCGWGASHDLDAAKCEAQAFLDKRDEWGNVFK